MKIKRIIFISFILIFIITLIFQSMFKTNSISIYKDKIIKDINIKKIVNITENNINKDILAYINIPKISLKKPLYNINSYYNNVDYSIEINNESNMPNVIGGNLILESHSGYNYNSFFKNLYKLNKNDIIEIEYNGYIYTYNINNIYNIKKNGLAKIKRDYDKSTLTLITCTKDNDNSQTIYISYLTKKECLV